MSENFMDKALSEWMERNAESVEAIYVGRVEWQALMNHPNGLHGCNYDPATDQRSYFGLPVFLVAQATHLRIVHKKDAK